MHVSYSPPIRMPEALVHFVLGLFVSANEGMTGMEETLKNSNMTQTVPDKAFAKASHLPTEPTADYASYA